MLGTTVAGRYEIEAQIGVGGMGIVYRAHDTKLRRDVALKMIAPHLMQQEAARARFLREAQALAGLTHPNIVTIFDMAEDAEANTVFLVMELLWGQSLRQFLSDETCPRNPACPPFSEVALPLCRALEAAHKRGILHRDIKPENIFVCDDGTLKLMDFGLARLLGDMSKNQSSAVAGTLAYMAPEQLRGEKLDARTDLYALGVVFFEYVTGTQPFLGDNPGTILLKHLTEPPPLLQERLPAPVDEASAEALNAIQTLIARMMAKEPAERPATAAEIRAALEQPLSHGETLAIAVDRFLSQSETGTKTAHNLTLSMQAAPVSMPTEAIAAHLTSRQTTEAPFPPLSAPTTALPQTAAATDTATLPQPEAVYAQTDVVAKPPTWKRAAGVLAGVGVLGAALVLAMSRFSHPPSTSGNIPTDAPHFVKPPRSTPSVAKTPASLPSASTNASTAIGSGSSKAPSVTAPTSALVSKAGDKTSTQDASASSRGEQASAPNSRSQAGKSIANMQQGTHANTKSNEETNAITDNEREVWRKQQQEELALIRSLKKELEAARALQTAANLNSKTAPRTNAPAPSNTKNSPPPVKLPPLPSVAEESRPPLVIGMRVGRLNRQDNQAVHISLQNDADCYTYFYLLPPREHKAIRLFAGYEYFAAAPKTPYAINLLPPKDVENSRGAILIVAAKKELKNLPASFELPQLHPTTIAPNLPAEQRQQIVRQNIHAFSDQFAQQLAAAHALQAGQLLQPHDVVIRLVGSNPMVFGRPPVDGRRGMRPNQPRGRRSFPFAAESGNAGSHP